MYPRHTGHLCSYFTFFIIICQVGVSIHTGLFTQYLFNFLQLLSYFNNYSIDGLNTSYSLVTDVYTVRGVHVILTGIVISTDIPVSSKLLILSISPSIADSMNLISYVYSIIIEFNLTNNYGKIKFAYIYLRNNKLPPLCIDHSNTFLC